MAYQGQSAQMMSMVPAGVVAFRPNRVFCANRQDMPLRGRARAQAENVRPLVMIVKRIQRMFRPLPELKKLDGWTIKKDKTLNPPYFKKATYFCFKGFCDFLPCSLHWLKVSKSYLRVFEG